MSDRTSYSEATAVPESLLPCPFCGKQVELTFKHGEWGYTKNMVGIRCEGCRIGFVEDAEKWEQGKGTFSIRDQAEQTLRKKWNTRSSQ